MKKLFAGIMATSLLAATAFGFAGCGDGDRPDKDQSQNQNQGSNGGQTLPAEDLEVYAPDGAPALALCYAISEEGKKKEDAFDFDIVDANTITTYVTGANPKADLCVLPVNAAAKVLGSGTVYQMLGTVTNGNLYFLTTGDREAITAQNLSATLLGKKVGVVQLANVPGLTLQAVLAQYGVPYRILQGADAPAETDKVNLIAFTPDNVTPAGGCDYYLCPEPAASTKIKGTSSNPNGFKMAGDLQELYGGEEGYPQAAVVAKKSVIQTRKADLDVFLGYLEGGASFLQSAEISTVLDLLEGEREEGLTPSFNEKNLTRDVLTRCSVRFTPSKNCKEKVLAFLDRLIAVDPTATAKPADEFFYLG